jgi:hypothetical protein
VKDTLKGGFWVALGLGILYLAVTGRLNRLGSLGTAIANWWAGINTAYDQGKPLFPEKPQSAPGTAPSVGARAQAIALTPLPVGAGLSMS